MAEFSKQYVQNFRPEMGGWDFDIEEVAGNITHNQAVKRICEGFGFTWVSKNDKGEVVLIFPDYETEGFTFKTLEETINTFGNAI